MDLDAEVWRSLLLPLHPVVVRCTLQCSLNFAHYHKFISFMTRHKFTSQGLVGYCSPFAFTLHQVHYNPVALKLTFLEVVKRTPTGPFTTNRKNALQTEIGGELSQNNQLSMTRGEEEYEYRANK